MSKGQEKAYQFRKIDCVEEEKGYFVGNANMQKAVIYIHGKGEVAEFLCVKNDSG